MFKLKKEVSDGKMYIAMEGILDTQTTPDLQKELSPEELTTITEVVFDFAQLEYLTSVGLRAILTVLQQMREQGGKMICKNVSDEIMEIFRLTGFAAVLTIE